MNPTNPYDTIQQLREQVAAQAAVIEKFKSALHEARFNMPADKRGAACHQIIMNAIAIPTDSTQILDEVRRAERDRVYQVADNAYATEHVLLAIRAME